MSQNKKSSIGFGPGAPSLILIFVVLALSVLGMLTLMNGRNDYAFSRRSAQATEAVYALNAQAEGTRADLDAMLMRQAAAADSDEAYLAAVRESLPEGMTLMEREIQWTEKAGSRLLRCAVRVLPLGQAPREEWVRHSLVSAVAEDEGAVFDW